MEDLLAARSQMAMSLAFQITLELLLCALAAGAILLFPSYYYLFRTFKAE